MHLTPFKTRKSFVPASSCDTDYDPFARSAREFGWTPYATFKREVDRLFDDFFSPTGGYDYDYGRYQNVWPVLDLKETGDEVIVTAELPGITEENVELYFDKGVLTIRGFKKADKDEPGYSERFYGRFERQVPLPYAIDAQHCSAEFRDGLLSIRFQKLAQAENKKKIPIKAAATPKTTEARKPADVDGRRQPEFVDS